MKKENNGSKLLPLFWTVFCISATANSGFAIVSAMKESFAKKHHWMEEEEVLDFMSIAQSIPGPIAVNASVLAGHRIAGMAGALTATAGVILPPLAIMIAVEYFYEAVIHNLYIHNFLLGMSAAVAALLFTIAIDLFTGLTKKHSVFGCVLGAAAFAAALFLPVSKTVIALCAILAGLVKALLAGKKGGNA